MVRNLPFIRLIKFCIPFLFCNNVNAGPVKVFILSGQSNMVGMGSIEHLKILANQSGIYRDALWNGTAFKERDDVYIKFNNAQGKLKVGAGYAARDKFGPELMFGWTVGDHFNETVYLIKSAYGGRSLAVDFRPPASGEGDYGQKPSHYGWEYRQMVNDILDGIKALPEVVPCYDKDAGFEISGFAWLQGWNDMLNWKSVDEYAFNLANFIRDVRLELETPDLPFVIGELGMAGVQPSGRGSDRTLAFRHAQLNVTLSEEFRNNTLYIPTSIYVDDNSTHYNGVYHYWGRADTYFKIGQQMGRGMIQLLHTYGSTQVRHCHRSNENYKTAPSVWHLTAGAIQFFSSQRS